MPDSAMRKIRKKLGGQSSLEGALDAMGKQREEQVLSRIREFTDQVVRIVDELEEVVRHFAADEYDDLAAAVVALDQLESRADDGKEEIADRLAMGGVFFMGRGDLARLVTSMDRIANYAVGAADRIAMRPISLPSELNKQLIQMVKIDVEAVRKLRDAVFAMRGDFRESIEIAQEVDKIESRADDVFASMYRFMFDWDTDFKTFHQMKSIIERLESIADACAENAELIRHMALEYLDFR
jgi:Phosphate transport regulator (distant homolog of PhoU)